MHLQLAAPLCPVKDKMYIGFEWQILAALGVPPPSFVDMQSGNFPMAPDKPIVVTRRKTHPCDSPQSFFERITGLKEG